MVLCSVTRRLSFLCIGRCPSPTFKRHARPLVILSEVQYSMIQLIFPSPLM